MQIDLRLFPMPVRIRAYARFRFGRWEQVRAHCRRLPRYRRQPPNFQVL